MSTVNSMNPSRSPLPRVILKENDRTELPPSCLLINPYCSLFYGDVDLRAQVLGLGLALVIQVDLERVVVAQLDSAGGQPVAVDRRPGIVERLERSAVHEHGEAPARDAADLEVAIRFDGRIVIDEESADVARFFQRDLVGVIRADAQAFVDVLPELVLVHEGAELGERLVCGGVEVAVEHPLARHHGDAPGGVGANLRFHQNTPSCSHLKIFKWQVLLPQLAGFNGTHAVSLAEGFAEGCRRIVAGFQGDHRHRLARGCQAVHRPAQAQPADVFAHRHADEGGEDAVEVERGEARHPGQGFKRQRLIQVLVDVTDQRVHADAVLELHLAFVDQTFIELAHCHAPVISCLSGKFFAFLALLGAMIYNQRVVFYQGKPHDRQQPVKTMLVKGNDPGPYHRPWALARGFCFSRTG